MWPRWADSETRWRSPSFTPRRGNGPGGACQSFGDAYGDDEPGWERWLAQVHLFAPPADNCIRRAAQTKRALFAAGFTWPSMVDASDEDGQHYVFECETAAWVPDGEAE